MKRSHPLERDKDYRILSIDPGTHTLGLIVSEVGIGTRLTIRSIETLNGSFLANRYEGLIAVRNDKTARLKGIKDRFREILELWNPDIVISEAPYLGGMVTAYTGLVECLWVLQESLYEYNPSLLFNRIDPASVKKAMGVSGKSGDKSLVKEAIIKRKHWLELPEGITLEGLDEHQADALAVALHYCLDRKLLISD